MVVELFQNEDIFVALNNNSNVSDGSVFNQKITTASTLLKRALGSRLLPMKKMRTS
jgi:hypothetical protein